MKQFLKYITFALLCIFLLSGCDNKTLLMQLNQRQSTEILAILQENGIEGSHHDNGKQGYSIQVAHHDFVAAVDLLRLYNLPSKNPVEIIHAFPGDSLVASPQAERSRLLSLIEQRLEQSLLIIPGVVNARVHVSYPLSSNNQAKQPQQVSSLITYAGNEQTMLMSNKIKLFLTNSFAEASYDNVSVVMVERPEIQRLVKTKPASSLSVELLISLVVLGAGIIIGLLLLWYRHKKTLTNQSSKKPNVIPQ